jgi:hypothetical protein
MAEALTSLPGPGRGGRFVEDRLSALVLALGLVAVALVAYFDLRTNLPFSDEYARRWTVEQLVAGHGIQLWGRTTNLVQTALSAVPALLHTPPNVWRLPGVPFLAMQGAFVGLIAARLGATRFWAAIAGAAVVCDPMNLSLSTGIMTETCYAGLVLAALWLSLRWISDEKSRWLCVLLAVLATSQRQQGLAVAVIVPAGLVLVSRRRRINLPDYLAVAALWVGTAAALLISGRLAESTTLRAATQSNRAIGVVSHHLIGLPFAIYATASLVPMLGLFLLPLAGGLLYPGASSERASRFGLLAAALAILGLVFAWTVLIPERGSIFPGAIFDYRGLGQIFNAGPKPALLAGPVFLGLDILVSAVVVLALIWRRRDWNSSRLGPEGTVLILFAASQLAFVLFQGQVFDRYYLVIAAAIIPIIAAAVSRSSIGMRGPRVTAARLWAVGVVVLGVGYYVAGEQDYIAWLTARDSAARIAYQTARPWQVSAGFETDAENVWIPAVDDPTAELPGTVDAQPKLTLVFADPTDPRPGVSYQSLAAGRIVIIPGAVRP